MTPKRSGVTAGPRPPSPAAVQHVRLTYEILPRDRLTRTLVGAAPRLVLLAAPPGFGKTTLIHQWRARDPRRFALVSLEAADSDPILFWTRVFEGMRALEPGFDSTTQIALRVPKPDILGTVVPLLAHDLHALRYDLVLALDDYHTVRNPGIHDAVALLLHWLPSNV